jgi:hypothetical protein
MIPSSKAWPDMRKVIDGLTPADAGKFISNDGLVIFW